MSYNIDINDDRVYWVWLTKVFGIANADLWRLCEGYESVGEFARLCQLGRIEELTRQQRIRSAGFSFDDARELIGRCENSGVKVISFESPEYPKKLRRIPNPPAVIYAKGDISLLSSKPAILVVGTRRPCDYSTQAAELICDQLSQMGITVITGVEQGIDSCAIEAALDYGGAAAGVCGKGIFDERHSTELCERVAQKGVLLSEYTDSSEFGSVRYDYRNRIMCGLSDGVLFVECSEKSHGLNNVSHAKRLGKPIFALSPADISDKRFFGQRDLIRNGACPVFDAYDILDRLKQGVGYVPTETAVEAEKKPREKQSAEKSGNKISTKSLKKVKKIQKIPDKDLHKSEMSVKIDMSALNDAQKKIHAVLSENGAVHINTLAEKLELPIPKIMSELMVMQLKGITEELPGRQIKLKKKTAYGLTRGEEYLSNLIIVESPTKVKTIKRYLSGDYEVVASRGHLRDLPKSKLGVDIENNFEPHYINIKDKEATIKEIKKKAKKCDNVYLAGDPDREGEAISWHLAQILGLDLNSPNRVTFKELTETGIKAGMSAPRKIDMNLVDAQQARRVLDRIVGYKLSPFLWRKVRRGLSAGRVQSVAVKMICDREEEIKAFVPTEYWSIDAKFSAKGARKAFAAKLDTIGGKKAELSSKEQTDEALKLLDGAEFVVANVKKSVRRKSPAAPFTTSTLQQEASKRMSFQARRTMKVAQELYEGVDIKDMGPVGLITYMRTDSQRISEEARAQAYDFIRARYGADYIPETPNKYKSKGNAQDAHEAIRPTHPELTPDMVKASGVTSDQYRLYKLIWERFIASQMSKCVMNTISADIEANGCIFKASGYSIKFDGFTVLYEETKDDDGEQKNDLSEVKKGDPVKLKSLEGNQHFTQPPSRYTEATLVKAFEETGIGRPSTYVPTITTILARNYVERDGKQLKPTSLGEVTNQVMSEHFEKIVDVKFTANMEDDLDKVECGKMPWTATLKEFYKEFESELTKAEEAMEGKRVKVPDEETDQLCELCGKPMVIKIGKFGKFMACSGFPECTNTKPIIHDTGGSCPLCGKKVLLKKSKKGKKYYGCENNPECNFMTWDVPVEEKCPKCGSTLFRKGGKNGTLVCHKIGCGYEKELSE